MFPVSGAVKSYLNSGKRDDHIRITKLLTSIETWETSL